MVRRLGCLVVHCEACARACLAYTKPPTPQLTAAVSPAVGRHQVVGETLLVTPPLVESVVGQMQRPRTVWHSSPFGLSWFASCVDFTGLRCPVLLS